MKASVTARAGETMRVALVGAMAAPYRLPVWEALGEQVEHLDVLLCSEKESNRIWTDTNVPAVSYRRSVLPGIHRYVPGMDWGFHLNPTLWKRLSEIQPEAIIVNGYDSPSYLMAMLWAKRHGLPLVLAIEGHPRSSRFRRGPIAMARRRLVRAADACLAHGREGAAHVMSQGYPPERIVTGILPVDVDRIARVSDDVGWEPRAPDEPVRFIFLGRLTEGKGVLDLLNAFEAIDPADAQLTIVGHGSLEKQLQQRLAQRSHAHIRYLGASTTLEDTARHLARADVMVMPTLRDVWGLVVNEALAAGLYVLSSSAAGATHDLIEDAPLDAGLVIHPGDPQGLAQAVRSAVARVRAGGVDRTGIAAWGRTHTPEKLARNLVRALTVASATRAHSRK